jgi:hypothetical protein
LLGIVTHRFTQEPRTTSALLALHSRWLANPIDLLTELTNQHKRFTTTTTTTEEEKKDVSNAWNVTARLHVLFVTQQLLDFSPELFAVESFWQSLRKAARAWQKQCVVDGGEPERKLRKWLKVRSKKKNFFFFFFFWK